MAAARSMRAISAASLTSRRRLDGVGGRHQLGRVQQGGPDPLAGPGHVVGLQADPGEAERKSVTAWRWSAIPPMVISTSAPAARTCSADWVR